MTMDRSLKVHGGIIRQRSVLTRAERVAVLTEEEKFDMESDSPLGLPKTKVKHSRAGTKSKKEETPAAEGAAAPAAEGAAPAAKGAAPGKGAAPAKGGKGEKK